MAALNREKSLRRGSLERETSKSVSDGKERNELSPLSRTLGRASFSFSYANDGAALLTKAANTLERTQSKSDQPSELDLENSFVAIQQTVQDSKDWVKSMQRLIDGQFKLIVKQREEIKRLKGQLPASISSSPRIGSLQRADTRSGSGAVISMSILYKGDVSGHQEALRQSVGQQLLGMGVKQTSAAAGIHRWGIYLTTFTPANRSLQHVVEGLQTLPSQCKILAVMHEVPSREVNIQSKYIQNMVSQQDLTVLEVEIHSIVDLLYDGSVWIDCPQNTDAICTLAEKIAASA